MEEKKLKSMTIKYIIGILVATIFFKFINRFTLGLSTYIKSAEIISYGVVTNKAIIISNLIKILSFIVIYYIMNKIILINSRVNKEDTAKLIRNIVIISIIAILMNQIIIRLSIDAVKANNIIDAVKDIIVYTISLILFIPIERKILNNKSEIDEEIKRKQNKTILYCLSILICIVVICIIVIMAENIIENEEKITISIELERDIDEVQRNDIEQSLRDLKYVKSCKYISKEEVISQMEEIWGMPLGNYYDIFSGKFHIEVKRKHVDEINEIYKGMEGIDEIKY